MKEWLEQFLLHGSIFMLIIITILLILSIFKISKSIKELDERKRKRTIKYMRDTSYYNKNKRKKL